MSKRLIYAEDAIDALAEWDDVAIVNRINNLPSAQPESCEGCKWENAFGYGECGRCRRRLEDMYERGTCENE